MKCKICWDKMHEIRDEKYLPKEMSKKNDLIFGFFDSVFKRKKIQLYYKNSR